MGSAGVLKSGMGMAEEDLWVVWSARWRPASVGMCVMASRVVLARSALGADRCQHPVCLSGLGEHGGSLSVLANERVDDEKIPEGICSAHGSASLPQSIRPGWCFMIWPSSLFIATIRKRSVSWKSWPALMRMAASLATTRAAAC